MHGHAFSRRRVNGNGKIMDIKEIRNSKAIDFLFKGNFGLEKECIRIDENGRMADTPHPFGRDEKISRDFSENQTEFITGVNDTPKAACDELTVLHRKAVKILDTLPTGKEYFWPFSNPPRIFGENDNPVARFNGEKEWKTEYRKYLKEKYGSKLMLYSGVHINFSLSQEWLKGIYEWLCLNDRPCAENRLFKECGEYTEFVNRIYMRLVAWGTRYSWLIVYLFGASPVFDASFFDETGDKKTADDFSSTVVSKYATPRCSEIGYWNDFDPILDYVSLERYIKSINSYVENGALNIPAELYYPVRIKSRGDFSMQTLLEKGIDHIEFRIIDDNPYEPTGVCRSDIEFMHLLMIYFLFRHESDFTPEKQKNALSDMKRAALLDQNARLSNGRSIRENAKEILAKIRNFYREEGFTEEHCAYIESAIEYQESKLAGARYADRVVKDFSGDYWEKGLELAKEHARTLLK